ITTNSAPNSAPPVMPLGLGLTESAAASLLAATSASAHNAPSRRAEVVSCLLTRGALFVMLVLDTTTSLDLSARIPPIPHVGPPRGAGKRLAGQRLPMCKASPPRRVG